MMPSETLENGGPQPDSNEVPVRQATKGEGKPTALAERDPNTVAEINGTDPPKSYFRPKTNQASIKAKKVTISEPTIDDNDENSANASQSHADGEEGQEGDEAGDDSFEPEATDLKKKKKKSKSKSKSKRGLVIRAHRLKSWADSTFNVECSYRF